MRRISGTRLFRRVALFAGSVVLIQLPAVYLTPCLGDSVNLPLAPSPPPPAISTQQFLASIGINTHTDFRDSTVWMNQGLILQCLDYLGINRVRDGLPNPNAEPVRKAPLFLYTQMMAHGIKFDFIIEGQSFHEPEPFADALGVLNRLQDAHPGGIVAIEGFNEIPNWPITYNGRTGATAAKAAQIRLYRDVRADHRLAGIPVYDLSYGGSSNFPLFSVYAGRADFQNLHIYPQQRATPGPHILREQSLEYSMIGPRVITEFGYYTKTNRSGLTVDESKGWGSVDPEDQGRLIMVGLLDAWRLGYSITYIYDLIDAYATTSPDDYFGLFNFDGSAKPAAIGIHNLTTLLKDTGTSKATLSPSPLQYSLTDSVRGDDTILMEKSNGDYWIAVWNETAAAHQVVFSLDSDAADISLFDPLISPNPIQTLRSTNTVPLSVADRLILVKLVFSDRKRDSRNGPSRGPVAAGLAPTVPQRSEVRGSPHDLYKTAR